MDVFVYGTLTDPDRAASVLETFTYRDDAVLCGLHRVAGTYPTLAPGGSVRGRLLSTPDVAALDEYEGIERGLYVRVSVPFETDDETAAVYAGDPDALDADASWPDSGSFRERVERFVHENPVRVRRA